MVLIRSQWFANEIEGSQRLTGNTKGASGRLTTLILISYPGPAAEPPSPSLRLEVRIPSHDSAGESPWATSGIAAVDLYTVVTRFRKHGVSISEPELKKSKNIKSCKKTLCTPTNATEEENAAFVDEITERVVEKRVHQGILKQRSTVYGCLAHHALLVMNEAA